jgi:hypothetical protein
LRALGVGDYSPVSLLFFFTSTIVPSRPPAERTAFLNRANVDSIDDYFKLAISRDPKGDAGLDEIALFASYFDLRPTVYLSAGSVRTHPLRRMHLCAHVLRLLSRAARWPPTPRAASRASSPRAPHRLVRRLAPARFARPAFLACLVARLAFCTARHVALPSPPVPTLIVRRLAPARLARPAFLARLVARLAFCTARHVALPSPLYPHSPP